MDEILIKAKSILKKYNQEHLLFFYDELNESQKKLLLEQILSINFDEIVSLYEHSMEESFEDLNNISPLPYIDKSKLNYDTSYFYIDIGNRIIEQNKFAVVTMAGRARY